MIRPSSDRKVYLCREPVDMTSFVSIGASTAPPSNPRSSQASCLTRVIVIVNKNPYHSLYYNDTPLPTR